MRRTNKIQDGGFQEINSNMYIYGQYLQLRFLLTLSKLKFWN